MRAKLKVGAKPGIYIVNIHQFELLIEDLQHWIVRTLERLVPKIDS
jgi:hypothetical protein